MQCPLCQGEQLVLWHQDARRPYWHCEQCALVSVPAACHLDTDAEQAIYDLHRNDFADAGYRRFLSRAAEPVLTRVAPGAEGLDFGCGPGPVLAQMLTEAGYRMALFDKFYYPDSAVLQCQYDFVVATEVVEHLSQPRAVWQQLWELLKPGGTLVVMTKRVRNQSAFIRWHYIQDPTHIAFYSDATFAWIGREWGFEVELSGADVVLLRKKPAWP